VNNDEQDPLSSSNHSKPDNANDLKEGSIEVPEEEPQVFAAKQEDRDHTIDGVDNVEQSQLETQAETIAAGVCNMYQSLDATPGVSCSCEYNVSVSSPEDLTQPPLYKPKGEDLHPPLRPSVSSGHCSRETSDIRRVLSWPGVGAAIEPAITAMHDLADPDKKLMYSDPDTVCSHMTAVAKNVMNTSATTKEGQTYIASTSLQTTVGDVISRFAPTCRERQETSIYYPESENSEYLNNFFYCSKHEDGEAPLAHQPQSDDDRFACAEPCEGIDQFDNCHVGDAIRGGFDFLFRPNRVVHRSSPPPTLGPARPAMKDRSLSVGRIDDSEVHSNRWFGVIDMSASRFSFVFPNSRNDAADKPAYQSQLQPPCLRKSSSHGSSKMPPRHNRANSSHFSGGSFDKYVRSQQFPGGVTSDSQFFRLCGMSRDAFLSLPKEDRVRVAGKVEDNFPHLQRRIPADSVSARIPVSLIESLDLSAT
jgi:hypothetical protein